jgi:hypothetical protein
MRARNLDTPTPRLALSGLSVSSIPRPEDRLITNHEC